MEAGVEVIVLLEDKRRELSSEQEVEKKESVLEKVFFVCRFLSCPPTKDEKEQEVDVESDSLSVLVVDDVAASVTRKEDETEEGAAAKDSNDDKGLDDERLQLED